MFRSSNSGDASGEIVRPTAIGKKHRAAFHVEALSRDCKRSQRNVMENALTKERRSAKTTLPDVVMFAANVTVEAKQLIVP